MKITALIVIIFFVSNLVSAQTNAPKYSNEFLNIGVGARALGMGNAVGASTDDATAGYWNPTGLLNINTDLQLGLMHSEYFAGIAKYDFGGLAKTIDTASAFGVSFIRFGVDNIPNTTELIDAQGNLDYDRITYFSATDMAFIFSYARKLKPNLSIGGNVKVINRRVGDFARAWGFGIDGAIAYKKKDWRLAVVARDVTSTFNAWSYTLSDDVIEVFTLTDNEIPENGLELTLPRFILAASKKWNINQNFTFLSELNAAVTTDGKRNVLVVGDPFSIDPHLGLELGFKNIVYVRGGLSNTQRITDLNNKTTYTIQPNIGLGIQFKGVAIDYALTDIGDASAALYSNVFSLRFNLNPQKG
ncbi:MAG: PorV/PorQ family protein [Flavobacteriales bacterium]|jgi:hypothetical protein|nr:PorV/PorQ family protein [Flavobacteriales bacterium]